MKILLIVILLVGILTFLGVGGVVNKLNETLQKLNKIMATIADIEQETKDEGTLIDGLAAILAGLQQQVKDLLSGASIPPEVQTQIDQVFTDAQVNKAKLVAAQIANTPAAGTDPTASLAV